jgi:hypothetical protein
MITLTIYSRDDLRLRLENPSSEQVIEHINLLDGKQIKGLDLYASDGHLFIYASIEPEGRMAVNFSDGKLQAGILLDRTQISDQWFTFSLDNNQRDDYPSYQTVSKETALRVALHFFEYGTFPQEIEWEGNITI